MAMHQDFSKQQTGEPPGPESVADGVIISPDTHRENRLPPNQVRTKKWPVLHFGRVPKVETSTWQLQVRGLVENPCSFTWEEYLSLPRVQVFSDFHCVTRWSRLGNLWEGVSTREIARLCRPLPSARFVILHGYDDGWTTNLPIEEFVAEDALLVDQHDGEPISADHGGPVRVVVPRLYAWKSAKWLKAIELSAEDRPGYWERGGYHNHGDPWKEERHNW
jgi:DMSO/TMAO reductase YedYZ molybdopterin-dependent catalytic subunit